MSVTGSVEVKKRLIGKIHLLREIPGYSAYEIALKNGFKGTEKEWLASLVGPKGDIGALDNHTGIDSKGYKIKNVADPTDDGDAVNKKYADNKYYSDDNKPTAEDVGAVPNTGGTIYGPILMEDASAGFTNRIKGTNALHLIGGNGDIFGSDASTGTVLSLIEGGRFAFVFPGNVGFVGRIDTETVDSNGNNPNARIVELVTAQENDTVIRVQNSLHAGTLFASHWGCFGIWSEYRDDANGIEPKFLIARDQNGNLFMDGNNADNGGTPYHSKNKPSGSYTGTGATQTIKIGGIGKLLYIWSNQGTCHVTDLGWAGITGTSANSGTASSSNTASFKDGELKISISESTHERVKFFNMKDITYYYQVL